MRCGNGAMRRQQNEDGWRDGTWEEVGAGQGGIKARWMMGHGVKDGLTCRADQEWLTSHCCRTLTCTDSHAL